MAAGSAGFAVGGSAMMSCTQSEDDTPSVTKYFPLDLSMKHVLYVLFVHPKLTLWTNKQVSCDPGLVSPACSTTNLIGIKVHIIQPCRSCAVWDFMVIEVLMYLITG